MSQCFHEIPSAKRGVIGPRDLQSVLTLTAQNLGVPPQLFVGSEQLFERPRIG